MCFVSAPYFLTTDPPESPGWADVIQLKATPPLKEVSPLCAACHTEAACAEATVSPLAAFSSLTTSIVQASASSLANQCCR